MFLLVDCYITIGTENIAKYIEYFYITLCKKWVKISHKKLSNILKTIVTVTKNMLSK